MNTSKSSSLNLSTLLDVGFCGPAGAQASFLDEKNVVMQAAAVGLQILQAGQSVLEGAK